ncbi:hypothetical protein MNQ98_10680 [Paenibacillus sp. N3/727]|uniref:hypothetical protein n=1 Tax=Paenibacillus sp. N3/727 TaxID=2925845 RepID=UPI001F535E60|nr:hypothetical protein [Paenibacillus sp. N3/727]UNK20439.1 hypothetical protein MNQ98_10680 [Paenibacillus sp. N3/727]
MRKYPEYIYEALSQRLELTHDETGELTEREVFKNLVAWKLGYTQWSDTIKEWVRDVYGIELE